MSNNLDLDQVAASQSQKEITINDQSGQLDAALTDLATLLITSTNARTLTADEFRRFHFITIDEDGGDPATAAITLTVPAISRGLFVIINNTAFAVTVEISAQPLTSPVIAATGIILLSCDGLNVLHPVAAGGGGSTTFVGLTDTPANFTNQSGQVPSVNNAENALEYIKTVAKLPARAATTVTGTLATAYENGDTIDGVALATNDRILLKDQSTGAENGVYIVQASGAPTRAADFDDDADVEGGIQVPVQEGDVNANTIWSLANNGSITVGTTALVFAELAVGLADNKIINGSFETWQRGTSFALGTVVATFQADRWQTDSAAAVTGTITRQGSTGAYRQRVQRTSGQTAVPLIGTGTVLETANVKHLAGKPVTISVLLKAGANFSPASSQVQLRLIQGQGENESCDARGNFTTSSSATVSNQNITTTETRYFFTVVLGSATTQLALQLHITPVGTAGADDWYEMGEVQIEEGNIVTPFGYKSLGTELTLCRRYFERITGDNAEFIAQGQSFDNNTAQVIINCEPKRVNPTVTFSGITNFSLNHVGSVIAIASLGATLHPPFEPFSRVAFNMDVAGTPLTPGAVVILRSNTAGQTIDINSEL